MPIRPENRDRYPADWPQVSRAVKDRAGWRCECLVTQRIAGPSTPCVVFRGDVLDGDGDDD